MFLGFLTVLIMLVVTYAFWREGLLTACCTFINVLLAGLVAFNFFEPLAAELDTMLKGSFLHGYEDCLVLVALFSVTLGVLRLVTNTLAYTDLDYPPLWLRGGGVLFGFLTGWLVSGFLLCALQTLPWHREFMGFKATVERDKPGSGLRRVLVPDRVWLALMHRAGKPFAWEKHPTFDPHGNFELRYHRYRRYDDTGKTLPDDGACRTR